MPVNLSCVVVGGSHAGSLASEIVAVLALLGRGCGRRRHVDDYAATDGRLRPCQSRCDVVLEPGAGQAGRHVDDVGVHDALLRSERRLPRSTMLSIRSVPILAAELAADYSRHRPRLTKFRSYLASTRRSKQTSWRGAKVLGGGYPIRLAACRNDSRQNFGRSPESSMNIDGLTQMVVKPCSHCSGSDSMAWPRSASASPEGK